MTNVSPQEFYRQKRDALIKEFEGFRSEPYLDGVGVPTIGYGTTSYPDGRKVTMNDQPITQDVADTYYQHHIDEFSDHLQKSPGFSDLDAGTQAALTSFAYNTGPNVFTAPEGYETLQGAVRSGDKKLIGDAMSQYINKGTSTEAGLIRRRAAEIDLMNTTYPAMERLKAIRAGFDQAIPPQ